MNAGGRLNTCKSDGNIVVAILLMTSGVRVRNTCATYLVQEQNAGKLALIFHNIRYWHQERIKAAMWYKMGTRPIR